MAKLYRQGRRRAFQALFEAEFERTNARAALQRGSAEKLSPAELAYAETIVDGVGDHREEIDMIVQEVAPAFPISQIAIVDRTVLRIALYELLFNNAAVPVRAVINDAVELAKTFGSDASRRFVNGVLGTVSRERLPTQPDGPNQPDGPTPEANQQEVLAGTPAETEDPSGAL
jgi:N utilization substance protein B